MRLLVGMIGIVAFVVGLLHFFSPQTIRKLDEIGKTPLFTMDQAIDRYRVKLGIFYLIAAAILIYVGFFLKG